MKLDLDVVIDVVTRVGIPLAKALEAIRASMADRGVEMDNAELDAMVTRLDDLRARAHADAQAPE